MTMTPYERLLDHITFTRNVPDEMHYYHYLIKCSTHCDEPGQKETNSGRIKLLVVKTANIIHPERFNIGTYIRFTPITNGSSGGFLLAGMSQECFDTYYPKHSAVIRKDEDILAATEVWSDD